jgi:hypothetical protein
MAKPPGPGKCVHCLKDVAKRNWDHVFPVSWYPDSTPPNTEKWKIPSCIPCNSSYGKIENDLRDLVGLCLDPQNPASQSIVLAALRSLNWKVGQDPTDAQNRLARGRRIMSQTLHGKQIPQESLYPGMPQYEDVPAEDRVGILIPAEYFPRMTEKIVRGIFYIEEKQFIEPPYLIDWYLPTKENTVHFQKTLDEFRTIYAREPGLVVQRAVTFDDEPSSLFKITFWEQLSMYATVTCE